MKTPQVPPLAFMAPLGIRRDEAELAKRKAAAPLKPAKPQEPCDIGLFGDDAKQIDLVDKIRRVK